MIDFGRILLVGRHETLPEEKRFLMLSLAPMLKRAAQALESRWPDRLEAWTRWNVAAWHVDGSTLNRVDLLRFEGLGEVPLPHLTERWVYLAAVHHIDPLEVPRDPPLLHRSSQVLDATSLPPREGGGKRAAHERSGHVERIRVLEDALEQEGLLDAPQAQTVRGMEALLRWKGLRLTRKGDGWSLQPIPDDERWSSLAGGDRLDQILPATLGDKGPRGLSFSPEVERAAAAR